MHEGSKPATVFDRSAALDRLGGDEQLLREIASLFLSEYPALIDAIRSAVQSGNAQCLERNAHALKGSVSNFDASAAARAAFHLESMGRSGNLEGASAGLEQLEAAFADLHPILAAVAAE
jgi:HPt (histidine-containing phosphotransfer) domain-containing protein